MGPLPTAERGAPRVGAAALLQHCFGQRRAEIGHPTQRGDAEGCRCWELRPCGCWWDCSDKLSLRADAFVSIFSASPGSPKGSTFDCLVFASSSEQECEEIIQRIGEGTFYVFKSNDSEMWSTKLPFHCTTCKSNVISCAEVTKMSRYFDSVGLVLFCYLSL